MKIIADKNIPYIDEAFSHLGQVHKLPGRGITADVVRDADMLLVRTVTQVNKSLLSDSKVRFVGSATIGYDHIDLSYLNDRKIGFSSAAGCNANSVGEYVSAALLVLANRHGFSLSGKTIGIIGTGNTGSSVAAKARALGMHVLLNDPPLARKTADPVYLPLDQVIRESDVLTFHVPLSDTGQDATLHMGNDKFFDSLNQGPFLINSSRGPVIHTEALLRALKRGVLRGAVIDVWENEPDISCPLLELVDIGTPHIAGYSRDGKANATFLIYQAACSFFGQAASWKPKNLPKPAHPVIHISERSPDGISHSQDKNAETQNQNDVIHIHKDESQNQSEHSIGISRHTEEILADIVRKGYDIEEDDRALRIMLSKPDDQRGSCFEQLRNEYPVRREFHSMKIIGENIDANLINTLKGLGFCHEPETIVSG